MVEKRSIWWKLYFYIFMLFNILIVFGLFIDDNLHNIFEDYLLSDLLYDIFVFLIYIISIIAVFGFVYQKRIFFKELWVFIFSISLIDTVGTLIMEIPIKSETFLYTMVVGLTIYLPVYFAMYGYAFKMNELWREENGK